MLDLVLKFSSTGSLKLVKRTPIFYGVKKIVNSDVAYGSNEEIISEVDHLL